MRRCSDAVVCSDPGDCSSALVVFSRVQGRRPADYPRSEALLKLVQCRAQPGVSERRGAEEVKLAHQRPEGAHAHAEQADAAEDGTETD